MSCTTKYVEIEYRHDNKSSRPQDAISRNWGYTVMLCYNYDEQYRQCSRAQVTHTGVVSCSNSHETEYRQHNQQNKMQSAGIGLCYVRTMMNRQCSTRAQVTYLVWCQVPTVMKPSIDKHHQGYKMPTARTDR